MEFQELICKALEVRQKAYAPYSDFMVEQHFYAKTAEYLLDATLKMLLMERPIVLNGLLFSKQFPKDTENLQLLPLQVGTGRHKT